MAKQFFRNLGNGVFDAPENPDTLKIILDGSSRPQYICEASPGSATSAAVWRIKKLTYDGSGNLTDQQWASGTNTYDKIADNYASYIYS